MGESGIDMQSPPPLPEKQPTCGLAVWSLVLGIAGTLCLGPLAGIPGLILGIIGLNKINNSNNTLGGKGLAIGGIVTSGVSFVSIAFISIIAAIAIPSLLRARQAANEGNAAAMCKQMTSQQAVFQRVDSDGNGVQDYWTGDVAGFYALEGTDGSKLKYIDIATAKADAAPLQQKYSWEAPPVPVPKAGYYYKAMTTDASGNPYQNDTTPDNNVADPFNNVTGYGFCVYPANYGKDGVRTFIINEEGIVYGMDTGGEPVDTWPGADPTAEGWYLSE